MRHTLESLRCACEPVPDCGFAYALRFGCSVGTCAKSTDVCLCLSACVCRAHTAFIPRIISTYLRQPRQQQVRGKVGICRFGREGGGGTTRHATKATTSMIGERASEVAIRSTHEMRGRWAYRAIHSRSPSLRPACVMNLDRKNHTRK